VDKRVGCRGSGADELKEHAFYNGVDWSIVYQQKYPPPLIPPRGEVNAADAFDIGSFDEEDTKGMAYYIILFLTTSQRSTQRSWDVVIRLTFSPPLPTPPLPVL
jgi:hypothetical protein